jgi:hypothetical protein
MMRLLKVVGTMVTRQDLNLEITKVLNVQVVNAHWLDAATQTSDTSKEK